MTPQFTASAYVRCENEKQRKEIIAVLNTVGYKNVNDYTGDIIYTRSMANGCFALCTYDTFQSPNGYIDCGTDIDLFLELAQMRIDTDKGQWFTNGLDWYRHVGDNGEFEAMKHLSTCRRATPQEVYEHLKKR